VSEKKWKTVLIIRKSMSKDVEVREISAYRNFELFSKFVSETQALQQGRI
jgi:hypothetical protein